MHIQLSAEAIQALKSLDRIPDSGSEMPRSMVDELLTLGLAYESRTGGIINMTAAGRMWLSRRAA
ncbi:hypothetical protein SAMN05446635_5974 [Burkholderia sp. OK233]|nr:hypothetical protein SAMN05446635_5974 [Burkholderia sp. OK233]